MFIELLEAQLLVYACMESLKAKSKNPRGAALSTIDGLSPWFPRDHRCIFCQREFRSGQALGGHMNVHRRERAKMMLSPSSSLDSLNTTSPNPSMVSSSTSSASSSLPSVPKLLPSVPACKNSVGEKASAVNDAMSRSQCGHAVMKRREVGVNLNKRALVDAELGEKPAVLSKRGENSKVWMKKEVAKLELSMDFMGGAKDDLDLELRLGRS